MKPNYSQYNLDELREMVSDVNREIERRRCLLCDERFNAMMQAIQEFKEVCPSARVCDYDISYTIDYMADRDNWVFGD